MFSAGFTDFAALSFAAFGLCYILGFSKITQGARNRIAWWAETTDGHGNLRTVRAPVRLAISLIECPMCSGFWMGLLYAHIVGGLPWLRSCLYGCITCGTNLFLALITGLVPKPRASYHIEVPADPPSPL